MLEVLFDCWRRENLFGKENEINFNVEQLGLDFLVTVVLLIFLLTLLTLIFTSFDRFCPRGAYLTERMNKQDEQPYATGTMH